MFQTIVKSFINYSAYIEEKLKKKSQYFNTKEFFGKIFNDGYTVGIVYDRLQYHDYYLKACNELEINYKLFDIRNNNWLDEIRTSDIKLFFIWPSINLPFHKYFWENKIWVLTEKLHKNVFPSGEVMWIYESKIRTREWLKIHNYPHPRTDVYHIESEAMEAVKTMQFPIVIKTDQGASASGVYIIRSASSARKMIKKAFTYGIGLKNMPIYNRHSGYIIFQQYLKDTDEWRIIRVGNSYFCRKKIKVGDFHSGSGDIIWAKPPRKLLDLTKEISDKFGYDNVNIDYFEDQKGEYLVNEIHALWGGKEIKDKELEGRYLYNDTTAEWEFQAGDYFRNRCANLRIKWAINKYIDNEAFAGEV